MDTVKIAMIGVGDISGIYLKNITGTFNGQIELIGVCDLVRSKAEAAQEKYGIDKIYETMDEAFADPRVDIILNLTRPYEHYAVTKAALEAGKHVYSEKPLGVDMEEGLELTALAAKNSLLLGGAPDTFLGASIQTCRRLIDDGFIGKPIGARAAMVCHGHETWHPDPEFYYKRGGGPMLDMGPYYVTALVNLLGRVQGVTGIARKSFDTRTITSEPLRGTVIDVDVPTYYTGILDFENGATATLFATFDVYYKEQASFEVYGTDGTLFVPDPNHFGNPIKLLRPQDGEIKEIPVMYDYKENSRALGLADMARALKTGTAPRAGCKQTLHVLEILKAFEKSSDAKAYVKIESPYSVEAPMDSSGMHGVVK